MKYIQYIFFWGTLFFRKLYMKNCKIKNKDNKISHEKWNSLRNKVGSWVELDSPDPLKHLPTGLENTERIASLNSNSQVLTEPVSLPRLPCRLDKAAAYCPYGYCSRLTIHSHRFDCNWFKLMCLCESSVFTELALLGVVCSYASFHCWPIQVYSSKSINTRAIPNQTPTTTKREDCYAVRAWPVPSM